MAGVFAHKKISSSLFPNEMGPFDVDKRIHCINLFIEMKEKFKLSDLEIGVYGDSITSFTVVFLLLLIAQKKLKKMFRKKAFIQTI